MIKAIIFDFFGVVGLSTYAMIAQKYNFTEQQHIEAWDLHKALDSGMVGQKEFLELYAKIIGISLKELTDSFAEAESNMGINKPVLDLIDELRNRYKVGLLTNVSSSAYRFVEPIVGHFDEVVASYKVRIAKPDVEIFEIMAERLGLPAAECLMVDDHINNCKGAESAGMQALLFENVDKLKLDLNRVLADSNN